MLLWGTCRKGRRCTYLRGGTSEELPERIFRSGRRRKLGEMLDWSGGIRNERPGTIPCSSFLFVPSAQTESFYGTPEIVFPLEPVPS